MGRDSLNQLVFSEPKGSYWARTTLHTDTSVLELGLDQIVSTFISSRESLVIENQRARQAKQYA